MNVILVFLAAFVFSMGVYWICLGGFSRLLVGLLLISQAINVMLFALAKPVSAIPPLIKSLPDGQTVVASSATDPLPQALILTAIVIGMGLIAVVVYLLAQLPNKTRTDWEEPHL